MKPFEALTRSQFGAADSSTEDKLAEALQEVFDQLESDRPIDRESLLERYPEVYDDLVSCLDNLDFINQVAPQLADAENSKTSSRVQPLATLGDFRIVREIGRGGMGVVYEAEQLSLGRTVALKVLPFAAMLDKKQLDRFKNEARAAATLSHPNIVPVHAVGSERGVHYYAMQLVEGQSLSEVICEMRRTESNSDVSDLGGDQHPTMETISIAAISTERSSNPAAYFRSVASLGIQAAEALAHAHDSGVIHRDIKPGNLLLDDTGKLWVTDFGLARLENDSRMTATGDLLGTLRYMAPEQALAQRVIIDHRADIYSLGVTLYEMLTLQPVFQGDDRQALLKQIAFEEPTPPRRIDHSIPTDLECIVLKAIGKDPDDRYSTAKHLADDLERLLAGEPIVAKRRSITDRAFKWSLRHRSLAASLVLTLVVTSIVLSVSLFLVSREQSKSTAALRERNIALKDAEDNLVQSNLQRDRAERAVSLARNAISAFIADARRLKNVPQMSERERDYFVKAAALYDELEQSGLIDAGQIYESASAHCYLAVIYTKRAEYEAARPAFEHAIDGLNRLTNEFAEEPKYQSMLALTHSFYADYLMTQGELAGAESSYRTAIRLARTLVQNHSSNSEYRRDLQTYLNDLGGFLATNGNSEESEAIHREAVHVTQELVKCDPVHVLDLISAQARLARQLDAMDRDAEATPIYRQALTAARDLFRKSPTRECRALQARISKDLGELLCAIDRKEALSLLQFAIPELSKLIVESPTSPSYKTWLADAYKTRARLQFTANDEDKANQSITKAVELAMQLTHDYLDRVDYRKDLAVLYYNIANVLKDSGKGDQALEFYQNSIELSDSLVAIGPMVTMHQQIRAMGFYNMGTILAKDPSDASQDKAEDSWKRSLSIWRKLQNRHPNVAEYSARIGATLNNLAIFERKRKELQSATDMLEEAVRQQLAALQLKPGSKPYLEFLGNHYSLLALTKAATKEHESAAEYAEKIYVKTGDRDRAMDKLLYGIRIAVVQNLDDNEARSLACGQYAKRLESIVRDYVESKPDDITFQYESAYVFLNSQFPEVINPQLAAELIDACIRSDSENAKFKTLQGNAYFRMGRWLEAAEAISESNALDTAYRPMNEVFLAMALWRNGNRELAKEKLHQLTVWMASPEQVDTQDSDFQIVRTRYLREAHDLIESAEEPDP